MKLFKWDFLKIIRDWKVRILLVALFLFLASYSAFYQDRDLALPLEELRSEYEDTQQIFNAIQSHPLHKRTNGFPQAQGPDRRNR